MHNTLEYGVFSDQFREITQRPTWLVAILVLTLLATLSAGVEGPKTDWQGLHPFRELPQTFNPISDYVQNCNSTPFTTADDGNPAMKETVFRGTVPGFDLQVGT